MNVIRYNLRENAQLRNRLLYEASIVPSEAEKWPNYVPEEAWTGAYAKYESLLKAIGAKPFPLPYGKQAAWEAMVAEDKINFYDDGTAYLSNKAREVKYGVDEEKRYNGIILYDEEGGNKIILGAIERGANGKPKWIPPHAEDVGSTEESWVDYLQLALDVVGVVPGFGDIADIINSAISFGRGNYLEGFLSLIGAIPVVGSIIAIPLKLVLKGFNKAGDLLKIAYRGKKSADEVWLYVKTSGKLGPKELDALSKGMGDVSSYISKFRKDADWVLPNNAASALDEFAAFLKKQGDGAEAIFKQAGKHSDEAASGILKVRKELDKVGGLERIMGGKLVQRLKNTFTRALSPKELKALRGAMDIKFFKNMDNPGKLSILANTDPNLAKTTLLGIGGDVGEWFSKIKSAPMGSDKLFKEWTAIGSTFKGSPSKLLEQQLAFLKKNNPDIYKKAHANIVDMAQKSNNPLYKQFMNSEINGMGSYFSKDYTELAGMKSAMERWSNMAPIVYNELSDMGEDALYAAGVETKDDVNGLFWPILKSTINTVEKVPIVGSVVTGVKSWVVEPSSKLARYIADDPTLGAYIDQIKQTAGVDAGKAYDPTVKFRIVPDDSPEIEKREKEKEKRIQQNKSFF